MRPAYDVIAAMHHSTDTLLISMWHNFTNLNNALARDDLAPHPDDVAVLDALMAGDAEMLRSLAHEIEMRRIDLKRDALDYRLQAMEEVPCG